MTQVEAVYRNGKFEPLGRVDLAEGEKVDLNFRTKRNAHLDEWHKRVQALQTSIAARTGVLPDSTLDIAADRMR